MLKYFFYIFLGLIFIHCSSPNPDEKIKQSISERFFECMKAIDLAENPGNPKEKVLAEIKAFFNPELKVDQIALYFYSRSQLQRALWKKLQGAGYQIERKILSIQLNDKKDRAKMSVIAERKGINKLGAVGKNYKYVCKTDDISYVLINNIWMIDFYPMAKCE